jgi:vitamin B12 transporter
VGTGSVGYDGGATGKFSVVGKYGDALDHFPTGSDGSATDHNQFTTETSLDVGLDASRAIGRVELSVHGFASRLNSGFQNMQDTPADTNGFGYDANSTGITWRRGGDARLDWHTGIRSLLSVGAGEEYESDNEQSRDVSNFGFGTEVDTASSDANRITRNVYTQFLAAPTPAISLQLGGRLDDNSAFGTYGTWRVGASWRLASYTRVWGAEGTAIKSPTFSQLFANTAFEVGNPGLTPEHSTNSELGVEQRLRGNHTTLRATFFYQKFKDLIQYVSAAPGDPTYVNLGGTRSRGLELSLISVPSRRLSIAAHWTFLSTTVTDTGVSSSAEVEEGQPLVRRPASSGGATAEYHLGPAMVSVTGSWIGPRYDVDFNSFPEARVTLPSYFTADLGVDAPIRRATSRTMGFDLTLRGENLFNAVYQQALGFPGRGRTLLVGGRLSY